MKVSQSLLLILWIWGGGVVYAQDTTKLTNDFKFKNGIYTSFKHLQNNLPTHTWEEVNASAYVNREKYIVQFEYIKNKVNFLAPNQMPLDSIWGVVVDGVPYIRLTDSTKNLLQFVGLRTRGKICYFTYESHRKEEVPMTIYDPTSNEPIYTTAIKNKVAYIEKKILHFKTGEIVNFTVDNFIAWSKDDVQLMNTMRTLSMKEAQEKLYRLMLIYNDRNLVYIRQ